ncbi:MAG: oxidoreductase [Pseudonocardiaceae bacterium]
MIQGAWPSLAGVLADPLAPLMDLPGVGEAVTRARDAVRAVYQHPVNQQSRWAVTSAEASVRAARASAALDGASPTLPSNGPVRDPVLAGALRVAEALGGLLGTWQRAPLQALARLHLLASTDLSPGALLGRPRSSLETTARLDGLAQLVTGGSRVAAPVLVAVVHGELLTLAPFVRGNGVVARAAARLTVVSSGLDPKGLVLPEVAHLHREREYRAAAAGFASGSAAAVGAWIVHCCTALTAGAREALSIAEAAASS